MNDRFNEDGLMLSGRYAETMERFTLPFLRDRQRDEMVPVKGGELFCSVFSADQPRGTVVMLHGFTENAFKFSELIYSLLQNGFDVVAYDQRGHGRSCRTQGIDDLSLTDVKDFGDYGADLEAVMERIVQSLPKPWMVFAHSMGGAVASLYMERHPDAFSRAALCAPMIAPNIGGLPLFLGKWLCGAAFLLGKGSKRVFLSRPYEGPEDFSTSCATGKARFDWYDAVKAAHPEFQNNGPTYSWLNEALRATAKILRAEAPEKIRTAVEVYTAEEDNSVLPQPQEQFVSRLQQGRRFLIRGARHEIYRSSDEVLFPWWRQVLDFLKEA